MTETRNELYMGPVEVITSVARRRRWSPEEKRAMVEDAEQVDHNHTYTFGVAALDMVMLGS